MKLPEALDFLHWQIVAGKVQQGVNQHRTMSIGQDEPIAVCPLRICGVVAQVMYPQYLSYFRHAHRHSRMPRIGFLHSIHRQCANSAGEVFKHRRFKISKCSHGHKLPRSTITAHKNTAPPQVAGSQVAVRVAKRLLSPKMRIRQYNKIDKTSRRVRRTL